MMHKLRDWYLASTAKALKSPLVEATDKSSTIESTSIFLCLPQEFEKRFADWLTLLESRPVIGQASRLAGTFGLGLALALTPALALELAWDLTSSEGNNSGTVVAQAVTLGLRLRF